jgi:S-adenosylmethionine:tRNA ribosyltransferase-isomerase
MVLHRAASQVEHRVFRDLPELLAPGDLLVVNDTRVMAARLTGRRADTGGAVEALLIRPLTDLRWETLFRPARAASPGRRLILRVDGADCTATVVGRREGTVTLDFDRPFDPATAGSVPLPPYIKEFRGDAERYQTIYASHPRSAAAPTAGLHFTPETFAALERRGIRHASVTLAVGPGTFKPVTVADPRDHVLHEEHITVPAESARAIEAARVSGRRIVAVGTTVVRTLEHVARANGGRVMAYDGWTGLKILPGDGFQVVDIMLTNFHLPRSTLLMLVAAFAGIDFAMAAYELAVAERYRFYSFGDAMLILP